MPPSRIATSSIPCIRQMNQARAEVFTALSS
jgi:hypothetical protein